MNKRGFIFDMDGVIVDTAHFHYLAWRKVADQLGFELTPELNEQLKGVSRIDSLEKILDWAEISIEQHTFDRLSKEKNDDFLTYVDNMTKEDILPGVYDFIQQIKSKGHPVALGSASKNAPKILEKVSLSELFDAVVDGNHVEKAKPDPEVFLVAANALGVSPSGCIVFEDSQAGIQAANIAGMISIGIGDPDALAEADHVFSDFTAITTDFILQLQPKQK